MDNKVKDLIKNLFKKHDLDHKEVFGEIELAEATLEDGTVITSDTEFAVGVPVMVKTEDGTPMPLPEGSYSLQDGTAFTVDAEGVLLTWGAEEEEEEMSSTLTEEKVESMIKEAVSTMLEEFSKIQEEGAKDAEAKIEELSKELETALSKADAESSKKPRKVEIQKSFEKMSKKERMMYAFNSRKK